MPLSSRVFFFVVRSNTHISTDGRLSPRSQSMAHARIHSSYFSPRYTSPTDDMRNFFIDDDCCLHWQHLLWAWIRVQTIGSQIAGDFSISTSRYEYRAWFVKVWNHRERVEEGTGWITLRWLYIAAKLLPKSKVSRPRHVAPITF